MTGLIIEGGAFFLLLFTPFAFGGVELWAMGVVQVVAGLMIVAWAWDLPDRLRRPWTRRDPGARGIGYVWAPVALFVLLVVVQLVPMPPGVIRVVSPGAYDLYSRTLPGYTDGRGFSTAEIPAWVLSRSGDSLPAASPAGEGASLPPVPLERSEFPTRASAWRTLSVYPFATRQMLVMLLSLVAVFIAVSSRFTTSERLRRLLGVAVFSGFAVSLVGILQKVTWEGELLWFREVRYPNVFGPFVNRNNYAAFAVTLLPLALSMALESLRRWQEGFADALPRLFLWGFGAVTITAGIFHSLSRGGILAAALSMAAVAGLVFVRSRRRVELAMLAIMAVSSAGFVIWIGPERVVERIGTLSDGAAISSFDNRLGAWERTTDMIADHALLGSGLGTFRYGFMRYAPPGESWWMVADNSFIELACETGLAGGALFIAAIGLYLARTLRAGGAGASASLYPHAGLVAGLLALLFASVSSSNLQMPANALVAVVLSAPLLNLVTGPGADRQGDWRGDRP